MNIEEYAALVKEMRDAQKKYFRERSIMQLNKAKVLEIRVDMETGKILNPEKPENLWVENE